MGARLIRIDTSPASSVVTCAACPSFRVLRLSRGAAELAAAAHRATWHKHAASDAAAKQRRTPRSSTLHGVSA